VENLSDGENVKLHLTMKQNISSIDEFIKNFLQDAIFSGDYKKYQKKYFSSWSKLKSSVISKAEQEFQNILQKNIKVLNF